jgi:hypothetical protein
MIAKNMETAMFNRINAIMSLTIDSSSPVWLPQCWERNGPSKFWNHTEDETSEIVTCGVLYHRYWRSFVVDKHSARMDQLT